MKRSWCFPLIAGVIFLLSGGVSSHADAPKADPAGIVWQTWDDSVFARAKREHKFVLLDLQAVWCHWCHVMDQQTYHDPKVMALIQSRYIAVRVDQDSRPDLANRYEDYGWPATVVFNADGGEIVKRRGYLPPPMMASMLQAIIDDPSPGPSVTSGSSSAFTEADASSSADTDLLRKQLLAGYDAPQGSWGTEQKFLNWDNVEYCLVQAQQNDAAADKMARQTLAAQLKLVDPVWGGVDQYSAGDDWDHPHFEKIMQVQAENIRIYAEAYGQWQDPVYLKTAEGIYGYVRSFLTSPEGVVYTSQDADLKDGEHAADYYQLVDVERRKQGIPRVDQHVYARENGWFIQALTTLYAVTGKDLYRDEAVRAGEWIVKNRLMPNGGFQHGDKSTGPLYLGDQLAMGRAFLALYTVTADRTWLNRAEQTAGFIEENFAWKNKTVAAGYATAKDDSSVGGYRPAPEFDENVYLARFANLLFQYTANIRDQRVAQTALRYVRAPEIAQEERSSVGGLLLAEMELASPPVHIAIVGSKSDPLAKKLFLAALAYPYIYKQVEWIDRTDPAWRAVAGNYPQLPQAAAYTCANNTCSPPVFDVGHLVALLDRKVAPKTAAGNGP